MKVLLVALFLVIGVGSLVVADERPRMRREAEARREVQRGPMGPRVQREAEARREVQRGPMGPRVRREAEARREVQRGPREPQRERTQQRQREIQRERSLPPQAPPWYRHFWSPSMNCPTCGQIMPV